jgi:hypothetical protein
MNIMEKLVMSVEHGPQAPERTSENAEIQKLGAERLKELAETSAENPKVDSEKRVEEAREKLTLQEVQQPEPIAKETGNNASFIKKITHGLNYADTLASVQRRLSPRARSFSKVIHAPVVEKTSAVLEKTVMRPSVTLGATWTALIVGVIFYWTARHYGFRLSGSEMIIALLVGGLLGGSVEWFGHMLRKRKS